MAEPPTSQAGEILIGNASGGRRPPGHDHRAIVALVADVARRRQLCVGRGELVAVLGPECPVADHQRIFDRRRDQIGEGQIPIFRQDFGNLGEGFAQLIELIGGMASSARSRRESDTRKLRYRQSLNYHNRTISILASAPRTGAGLSLLELEMPDLDLIKHAEQGARDACVGEGIG